MLRKPDAPERFAFPPLAELQQAPGVTAAVTLFVLALGITGTAALAREFRAARTELAAMHFADGRDALSRDNTRRAVVELRAAVALDREHTAYGLLLAGALLEDGSAAEALTYLEPALRADPTSGEANELRARIARALGDAAAATTYYQRALFGSWTVASRRLAAAYELVDFEIGRGRSAQARGTLAQIAGDVPSTGADLRQFAAALQRAGAAVDAREVYRRATALDARDTASWVALATLAFEADDFRGALQDARQALALAPGDATAQHLADVSTRVLALDPEAPRLSVAQRLRRERALLGAAAGAVDACPAAIDLAGGARGDAATLLAAPSRRFAPEAARALTEQLWQARLSGCPQVPPTLEAVAIVMRLRSDAGGTR